MFSKRNLISTLVTFIWGFMGGYLLWGIIIDPFLKEHLGSATGVPKTEPDFLHLAIGCLIVAFAFSTIYSKLAAEHSVSKGLKFGIWVGVLRGLGSGFIDFSTTNIMDVTGTIVNGITYIVFFAIMGALAGLVYDKVKA